MLGAEALPFLVYAVIGAPIVEELTFRKALCDRLHDTHEGYAAVISGLLFGLMHGNHQQFFLAFFIGMLFAMVYQRTGRIVYTMLLHGMINFTATLPEFFSLAGVDINLGWNIAVGALILAGLVVLLVKRKDPILHAAPCVVQDANNAVYRNLGMRIVRVAALVLIGVQGIILIFAAMAQSGFEHWALCLIDLIPLTLVFLTVFLLPAFTKCYERDFSKLHPKDCTEEAGV
jgi:membrane protease YdiL (CAAX protease family)